MLARPAKVPDSAGQRLANSGTWIMTAGGDSWLAGPMLDLA